MFESIFTYTDVEEAEPSLFGFSGVTMLRDFGPLKKGDQLVSIWFDTEKSKVSVFKDDAAVESHVFNFRLEA